MTDQELSFQWFLIFLLCFQKFSECFVKEFGTVNYVSSVILSVIQCPCIIKITFDHLKGVVYNHGYKSNKLKKGAHA